MKVIEGLVQNSPEWHQFRKSHVGASESSALLQLSPYRSPIDLWQEKVLGWEQPITEIMRAGQAMEEEARNCFVNEFGLIVRPIVAESDDHPFISASFDGMADDMKTAVEIKCGRATLYTASRGVIGEHYMAQLQHQMYVGDLQEINYFCYGPKEHYNIVVQRDDELIKELIAKILVFWYHVQTQTPLENYNDTTPTF